MNTFSKLAICLIIGTILGCGITLAYYHHLWYNQVLADSMPSVDEILRQNVCQGD